MGTSGIPPREMDLPAGFGFARAGQADNPAKYFPKRPLRDGSASMRRTHHLAAAPHIRNVEKSGRGQNLRTAAAGPASGKRQLSFGRAGVWREVSGPCPPSFWRTGESEWAGGEDRVPTGCRHEKDGARSRKAGQDRRVQPQKDAGRANLILQRAAGLCELQPLRVRSPCQARYAAACLRPAVFRARARNERNHSTRINFIRPTSFVFFTTSLLEIR